MASHLRSLFMSLVAAIAVAATVATAQQAVPSTSAQTAPLTQTIPVDPQIRTRTLPNGLRYYVRANRQPQGRAELRLAVKAGSVLEDDDQRGLAHFVEHMSFNGTRNFPKQDVVAFMQGLGMRFGAHVNAHTGFDQTVYQLQIPAGNPAIIDRSLLILEDWAQNVSFDPQEVERERGVILEEWRLGLGAQARVQEAQMPVLLSGSRYAERSPIGRPDIIRTASRDRLKQFYTDWYRPDLMAVIAVGDFDPAAVESAIVAHFGPIPATVKPRPLPVLTVADQPGTRYTVVTDKEVTTTTVGVFSRMAARDQRTVGAYRQQMVERLFSGLLSDRLDEIANKPGAPFLAAQTSRGLLVRAAEVTVLNALVPDDGVTRGLTALLAETDRVARYGFTQTELDRQKSGSTQYLERAVVERDKSPSAPLADEYIRNFMNDEPIPGIVYEHALAQRFLPEITLEEVNRLARTWAPDGNRVVAVTGPAAAGRPVPSEQALAAAIKSASDGTLARVRRSRQHHTAARPASRPGDDRERDVARGDWRDRVAPVERRARRPQTDDVQGGRDSIQGRQPGRHLDGQRRRFHRGQHGRRRDVAGRAGCAHAARPEQSFGRRQHGGESPHRRHGGGTPGRLDEEGPGDDVPAHLPHVHRAAGGRRGVCACSRRS